MTHSELFKVVIGIPTYRRPQTLRRLLGSIGKMILPDGIQVEVLVADNEGAEGMGLALIESVKKGYRWPLQGIAVLKRGLSENRNELLQYGFGVLKADALVMLDDDMWVQPQWLDEVVRMQKETGAGIVTGQMVPVFPKGAQEWVFNLGIYQNSRHFTSGVVPMIWGAGNIIVMRDVWERWPEVQFNPAFSLTGGEDEDYFNSLKEKGVVFAYAPGAVSHEMFEGERITRRWVVWRAFRIGIGEMVQVKLRKSGWVSPLVRMIQAVTMVPIALGLVLGLWWFMRYRMKALNFLAFQLGVVAGYFNVRTEEYARTYGG